MHLRPLDATALLDALQTAELLDPNDARRSLAASEQTGLPIEQTLLEFGMVEEDRLFRLIASQIECAYTASPVLDPALLTDLDLSPAYLKQVGVAPLRQEAEVLHLATSTIDSQDAIAAIAFRTKLTPEVTLVAPSGLAAALDQIDVSEINAPDSAADADVEKLNALANGGPVIKLVNDLIARAVGAAASDIHLEEAETEFRIRFRIDGVLRPAGAIPNSSRAAVVSRLKIMGDLNISERRRPQDGRAQISVRGRAIDLRISTLPSQYGESIVLRILDRSRVRLEWDALGYTPEMVRDLRKIIHEPNGIFLVAGPTGSGKTTALYTALKELNDFSRKIVSVEDPIEYTLDGITQVPVDTAIDMTFAQALRAILRQDPDVVMVGEIRDSETAEIAVRAALVGRLVLSTIHTNDAPSAVTRMIDLGVPAYLLSATLRGVLSQRLVATTCSECSGHGCDGCDGSGNTGRTVVAELLPITSDLAEAISDGVTLSDLRRRAEDQGYVSIEAQAAELMTQKSLNATHIRQLVKPTSRK